MKAVTFRESQRARDTGAARSGRGKRFLLARGFSLIEMIGVITVLVLLALALTPILIKQFDRIAGDKETAQLKAFAQAFRQGVVTTKSIPGLATVPGVPVPPWYTMIASNLGISEFQVRTNDRRITRAFLIDPNFRIGSGSPLDTATPGANTPPYYQDGSPLGSVLQDAFGNTLPPTSPRLMILSSLSQAIPAMAGPTVFDDLWNTPDGSLPAWFVWGGKPDDLKIQRINLSDLFVEIVLNNQSTVTAVPFSVDGYYEPDPGVPQTNSIWRYFIDSTVLALATNDASATPVVQYTEILHDAKSFQADGDWKTGGYVGPSIRHPNSIDLELVSRAFFDSPQSPYATHTPPQVWADMISYMSNYVYWADGGFSSGVKPAVDGAQNTLASESLDLVTKN